jgi:hypothetical protein
MSFRAAIAATVLCAAAFTGGCGGGDDAAPPEVSGQDRAALERLSEEISRSVTERDAASFCTIVQPSLVEEAFGGNRGCLRAVRRGLEQNSEILDDLEIEKITVRGEGAIVSYAQDPPGDVLFVREQGEWYLALNDLSGQRQGATGGTGSQGDG